MRTPKYKKIRKIKRTHKKMQKRSMYGGVTGKYPLNPLPVFTEGYETSSLKKENIVDKEYDNSPIVIKDHPRFKGYPQAYINDDGVLSRMNPKRWKPEKYDFKGVNKHDGGKNRTKKNKGGAHTYESIKSPSFVRSRGRDRSGPYNRFDYIKVRPAPPPPLPPSRKNKKNKNIDFNI